MWAEAGDFRDNTHSAMSAIPSSMDHHSQLSFQASSNASRGRSRDRKADGKLMVSFFSCLCLFALACIFLSCGYMLIFQYHNKNIRITATLRPANGSPSRLDSGRCLISHVFVHRPRFTGGGGGGVSSFSVCTRDTQFRVNPSIILSTLMPIRWLPYIFIY